MLVDETGVPLLVGLRENQVRELLLRSLIVDRQHCDVLLVIQLVQLPK